MNERSEKFPNALLENNELCCNNKSCCSPKLPIISDSPKVGRNNPCIGGSGRKFRKCCGKGS